MNDEYYGDININNNNNDDNINKYNNIINNKYDCEDDNKKNKKNNINNNNDKNDNNKKYNNFCNNDDNKINDETKMLLLLPGSDEICYKTIKDEKKNKILNNSKFKHTLCSSELIGFEFICIYHFFYNDFYVYKYGISTCASYIISERLINGDKKEQEDYFKLLKV